MVASIGKEHACGKAPQRKKSGEKRRKRGKEEMVIVQCSFAICHFRMRLRRGIFNKRLREALPPMTNDN
jgi:hypothetical protein